MKKKLFEKELDLFIRKIVADTCDRIIDVGRANTFDNLIHIQYINLIKKSGDINGLSHEDELGRNFIKSLKDKGII